MPTPTPDAAATATTADPVVSAVTGVVIPASGSAARAENLTGQSLAADLSAKRKARRASASASQTSAGTQPKPNTTPTGAATAPAGDAGQESTDAKSASPSEPETDPSTTTAAAEAMADLVAQDGSATETEGAEASETETAPKPEAQPKAIREMQKRIDKLTAKLKAYEAGEAGGDARKPEQPAPVTTPEDHPELQAVQQEIGVYEAHLRWFDENPDGGQYTDAQGRVIAEVPAERVTALRRMTERKLSELLGTRAMRAERIAGELREARAKNDAEAVQKYPWLSDPEAPEFTKAQNLLAELPRSVVGALQSHPKARLFLGALVAGLAVDKPKPAPVAPRAVPPKALGAPSSAAQRVSPQDSLRRQLAEAEADFARSGRSNDHKRVLTLQRQLKRS